MSNTSIVERFLDGKFEVRAVGTNPNESFPGYDNGFSNELREAFKAMRGRLDELEGAMYMIKIREDSYDTEDEVLRQIFLIAEEAVATRGRQR